jgi:hypothetical protein
VEIPYDKDKIPVTLIEDSFALQAATHARFFLESTVIPAVFPGLAEYSARFGDVIYSFPSGLQKHPTPLYSKHTPPCRWSIPYLAASCSG